MDKDARRFAVNLNASINADNISTDIQPFDDSAKIVDANIISRNGGIQNNNLTEKTNTIVGNYFYTDSGDKLCVDANGVVYNNDKPVGNVSPYGVESRNTVFGANDVVLTPTGYVSTTLSNTLMTIEEYNDSGVKINSRTIDFTGLSTIAAFITSINIVRKATTLYSDTFEWVIRIGDQISFINESTPGTTILKYLQSTTVVGTNNITAIANFNGILYVAGGNRVGSFDGANWRNWDGSGTGIGGYSSTVLGTNNIYSMIQFKNTLVVAGQGGRLGSFDGTLWKLYDGTGGGLGISDNGTLIGTNDIKALGTWVDGQSTAAITYVIVGGVGGRIGCVDQNAVKYLYTSSTVVTGNYIPPVTNATSLGANDITSFSNLAMADNTKKNIIIVTANAGAMASYDGAWRNYDGSVPLTTDTALNNALNYPITGLTSLVQGGAATPINITTIFNGTLYAAFGTKNTAGSYGIGYSKDGINWTLVPNLTLPNAVTGIASGVDSNGVDRLVAVCYGVNVANNVIWTSTDGINWTSLTGTPASPQGGWESISYGNGVFIAYNNGNGAGGSADLVARSTDGTTWSFVSLPVTPGAGIQDVAYANGVWILVGSGTTTTNGIFRSTDNGATWTNLTTIAAATGWRTVRFVQGVWIAGATSTAVGTTVARSTNNGSSWAFATLPSIPVGFFGDFLEVRGYIVGICRFGNALNACWTSNNQGVTWVQRTWPSQAIDVFKNPIFYQGKVLVFSSYSGANSVVMTRQYNLTNLSGETTRVLSTSAIKASAVDTVTNKAFIGGELGRVGSLSLDGVISYDGKTSFPAGDWLPTKFNGGNPNSNYTRRIAFNGTTYINPFNNIYSSIDGINWTAVSPSPGTGFKSVVWGGDKFVAINDTGIWYSTTGLTGWTLATTPTTSGNVGSIAYGGGRYVVVYNSATTNQSMLTSTDGITWTAVTTTAPAAIWGSVEYGGGSWVAIAATTSTTGGIAYSTNGTSWTFATTTAPAGNWNAVASNGTTFVVSASSTSTTASVAYATIGTLGTWAFATLPGTPSSNYAGLTAANGIYYLIGGQGGLTSIATSYNASTWTFRPLDLTYYSGCLNICNAGDKIYFGQVTINSPDYALFYATTNDKTTYSNNGTAVGTDTINAIAAFNNQIVIGSLLGRLASFDYTNWKNYDGTGSGTGPYINSTPALSINALGVIGSYLLIGYNGGLANGMDTSWAYTPYNQSTAGGTNNNNAVYAYKYENGYYLWHVINAANNVIYIAANVTSFPTSINGRYAWPETKNSYTRHIITETPRGDASNIYVFSIIGFTNFDSTFSSTQSYVSTGQNITGSGAILNNAIGWNYGDVAFKNSGSAVNIFNLYGPQPTPNQSIAPYQFNISQGNTNNIITGYSKLSNTYGVTNPIEFRLNWLTTGTLSYQAFISVAVNDGGVSDCGGVLLNAVGEFDDGYAPQVDSNKILFRNNGNYYVIKISTSPKNQIQRVNDHLYKINTISPLNLFDNTTKKLIVSSLDYHGQVTWNYLGTPATTAVQFVANYYNQYSNSIDNGVKLVFIPSPLTNNMIPFGMRIPYANISDFSIDEFADGSYIGSFTNNGYAIIENNPFTPIYVPTTVIPYPIGQDIKSGGLVNNNESVLVLNKEYDGYSIGNELPGVFQASFILFGNTYIYDGLSIYITNIQNNIVTGYEKVCDAFGLQYIATTPEQIWFLSSFDNSLYTFNGGRNVQKSMGFINMDTINNGVYNSKENTLFLDATNHFITIRDGQITQIEKLGTQTNVVLYSTQNGIIVANNSKSWQYTLLPTLTSTPVPFSWQSGYYGLKLNEKCILSEMIVTIYDVNKTNVSLDATVYSYDESTAYADKVTFNVSAKDYNNFGIAKVRVQPKRQKSLGISLGITSNSTLFITEMEMAYKDAEESGIRNSK